MPPKLHQDRDTLRQSSSCWSWITVFTVSARVIALQDQSDVFAQGLFYVTLEFSDRCEIASAIQDFGRSLEVGQ